MLIRQYSSFIHSPCVSFGRGRIIFFMLVYGKGTHSLGFVSMVSKVLFSYGSHFGKKVFSKVIIFLSSQFYFLHKILPNFRHMYVMKKKPHSMDILKKMGALEKSLALQIQQFH